MQIEKNNKELKGRLSEALYLFLRGKEEDNKKEIMKDFNSPTKQEKTGNDACLK